MDSFIKSLCTNVTCLLRQFSYNEGDKKLIPRSESFTRHMSWICEPRWKNKHPINLLLWWLTDRYYAHSYLTCWGYLNTPHEGTNSSLLQANSFPNATTYVNGIQLLRKKNISTLFGYTFFYITKKNYTKNTVFPYGGEKKARKTTLNILQLYLDLLKASHPSVSMPFRSTVTHDFLSLL